MASASDDRARDSDQPGAGGADQPGRRGADQPAGSAERPEQRLEEWGRRMGRFLASAAARAREEAEDIVAEAQSIRRGERE